MNTQFTESNLRSLLEAMQSRASSFADHLYRSGEQRPIYLRFDIDDDPAKAYRMSLILNEYGIKGTFFILNTADYWNNGSIWNDLRWMQSKAHEIGWHNNVIAEMYKEGKNSRMYEWFIKHPLNLLREHGLNIIGSASHGDPLCRKLGFINYEIFKECERTSEAIGFPDCTFDHPRLSMADFGLEYEAYHVPYDLYLSESGGRQWTKRAPGNASMREATPWDGDLAIINRYERIQILIHPQHWKI